VALIKLLSKSRREGDKKELDENRRKKKVFTFDIHFSRSAIVVSVLIIQKKREKERTSERLLSLKLKIKNTKNAK